MTKNNGNLNHHEELRLDYLQKNIHYLNEKEQRELAYLEYKRDLRERYDQRSKEKARYEEKEYIEPINNQSAFLDEEVLDYPKEERRRTTRTKASSLKNPRPNKKNGWLKRVLTTLLVVILVTIAGMGIMFFKGLNSVENKPVAEVFNGVDTRDGVNILILGTDGRVGESSGMTRTDSIMVLNINNSDNKVKLVSFMRDILVDIEGYDYKLNTAYTLGEQDNFQGAEAVREVLKNNFDIDVKYYAMVDFSTFATTIDTLFPEGVTIDAQFATVGGEVVSSVEVPDDLNMVDGVVPNQTIHVGVQQMDGRTLLNYARFRKDDEGDYGRTKRQQQVMASILTQAKNPTKLFSGSEAIGKVIAMTPTTVPQSFMLTNALSVAGDATNGVERITIPENGDWVDDYDIYDGLGLRIDFGKYQQQLADLGFR